MIARRWFLQSTSALGVMTALFPAEVMAEAHSATARTRWKITGDCGITWDIAPGDDHLDFIEMSGEQIALVVRYGSDAKGNFSVNHRAVWPMLRFRPNLTESHLALGFGEDAGVDDDGRFSPEPYPSISVKQPREGVPEGVWTAAREQAVSCSHRRGVTSFTGTVGFPGWKKLSFVRAIFPSVDKPVAFDTIVLANVSDDVVELAVDDFSEAIVTPPERGIYGAYEARARILGAGRHTLKPGESATLTTLFEAHKAGDPPAVYDIPAEQHARLSRVDALLDRMQLETPSALFNTLFAFAKVHTAESIFRTKGGLMHAPGGGGGYYAAIWANDQAEYANPFFSMLGDPTGAQAAINSFRHFARFMNPEYRPIPSSIIAEGDNFWNGVGDRGDMAMIAYGAGRFALAYGDQKTGEYLWPLIAWCLEYLRRKVTAQGVVASDSDELEGRFFSGKANLSTSCLYYDALSSAVMLGEALQKPQAQLDRYLKAATNVRASIESYFGAQVEGFASYRYYNKRDAVGAVKPPQAQYRDSMEDIATKPDLLRAWIVVPLISGILDRAAGTLDAMFSPLLWTADGLASQEGERTIWDRTTLYGLRGALAAGDMRRGMAHLQEYSARRLLGDHVPYPIEAYPEGGKAQLAGESALYCRIFTEGLFGIRPIGFRSFTLTPRLPADWPSMALRAVHAFGNVFDIEVVRARSHKLAVRVTIAGKTVVHESAEQGGSYTIRLP